jgi:peroxiredoxin Q/BCP
LQEQYQEFTTLNAEIVAASVEDISIGRHVSELLGLQYPVLSDADHKVADLYGIYNLLGDSLATPSVFLIDAEGTIRWEYVGVSSGDRPSNDMILDQLRSVVGSQ